MRWWWLMWWFECRDIDMVSRLAYYYMSSKESYYVERRYWCSSSMSLFCLSHLCCHHYRCLSPVHDHFYFCNYRCCHSCGYHRRFHLQHHFGIALLLWSSLSFWLFFEYKLHMMKDEIDCHFSCILFLVICFVIIILVVLSSSSSFCGHSLRYQQCLCDWRNHRWLCSSSAPCFSLSYSCHCIIVISLLMSVIMLSSLLSFHHSLSSFFISVILSISLVSFYLHCSCQLPRDHFC